ncbi:MAG: outer membrane beta-barrel protein [Novosphingobium sp.]|nr:outer membrane beta-barrel protein [Novosphingobium sp.]
MTRTLVLATTVALALPLAAFGTAARAEPTPLAGVHVGVDLSRTSLESRQSAAAPEKDRKGIAIRAHVGYDVPIGPLLVGGEVGLGSGGRTVTVTGADGSRFSVDPGRNFDLSGRAGVLVVPGAVVYGRVGYAWLRTRQTGTTGTTELFSVKRTNAGMTYGGGVEVAVGGPVSVRAEYTHARYTANLKQDRLSVGASLRF